MVGHRRLRLTCAVYRATGCTEFAGASASGQILREYLSVATRPVQQNGLGLTMSDCLSNVRALRERLDVLPESEKASTRLLTLLADVDCAGKQVHDANIVATMLVHGVATIATITIDDFARYEPRIAGVAL